MNLAQLRVATREVLTAGQGINSTIGVDRFWVDNEINFYLNRRQRILAQIIKRSKSDYFTRILRTTDSPLWIMGSYFDPSTLKWAQGVGNYQLPPDFVRLRMMTDLTAQSAPDRWRIEYVKDIASERMRVLLAEQATATQLQNYYASVLGVRTLVVRPLPADIRDWEFMYEKNLEPLADWSSGTVSVTNKVNTVQCTSSPLVNVKPGDQLMVGDSVNTPTVDPNIMYPTVASVDSSTQITLTGPYQGMTVAGAKFLVSRVSEIPLDHHHLMVVGAAVDGFKKGVNPSLESAQAWEQEWNNRLPDLIADVEQRGEMDSESVEPYIEYNWNW